MSSDRTPSHLLKPTSGDYRQESSMANIEDALQSWRATYSLSIHEEQKVDVKFLSYKNGEKEEKGRYGDVQGAESVRKRRWEGGVMQGGRSR